MPNVIIHSNSEYEFPSYLDLNYVKGYEDKAYLNIEHLHDNTLPKIENIIHNGGTKPRVGKSNVKIQSQTISTCVSLVSEDKLKEHNLHLNHYTLQSKEFYFKVKIERGDAVQHYNRREESFKLNEKSFNQLVDDELAQKTKKRRGKRM